MTTLYLIGSLRNPDIPKVAQKLREAGFDVFDDWYAAGPEADDYWRKYETEKGSTLAEALKGYAAQHVFQFDKKHLDRCDMAVLVGPGGKSAHLELGYMLGKGKPGAILLPEKYDKEQRWDVMMNFAGCGSTDIGEVVEYLRGEAMKKLDLELEMMTTPMFSPALYNAALEVSQKDPVGFISSSFTVGG
jgi:nucleoside 2-deoxyribosyltransferase